MRVVLVVVFLLLTLATFDVAGRHLDHPVGGGGNNIWSYIWRNANDLKKLKTSMENSMAKMKTSIENLQKVIGTETDLGSGSPPGI